MQQTEELGFIHKWVPAESGSPDPVTLLLLHGTGGDENALRSVGNELWPGAALLGLRGKVLENGMPPSFRRFTEAGVGAVNSRTEELAQFIDAASERYGFSKRRLIVVGYSNGATLGASLILLHPHYLAGAVLFRAMVPLVPDLIRDFSHLSVFIGAARLDPLIPAGQAEELAALFKSGGADVTISWHQGGRELGEDDIQAAKHWALSRKHSTKSRRLSSAEMLLPQVKRRRKKFMTEKKRHNQLEPASFSAGQSGAEQGLPRDATADSESVEELLEEGNSFEAGVVFGVENSKDPSVSEVTTHEVPEDDVPGEYLNQD